MNRNTLRMALRDDNQLRQSVRSIRQRVRELLPGLPVGIGRDGRSREVALVINELLLIDDIEEAQANEPTRIPCDCGSTAVRKQRLPRTVQSVCGPIPLNRSVYRCPDCEQQIIPLDRELGIVEGSDCTAALREVTAFLHTTEPIETASETIDKTLGFRVAPSVMHRAVQIEGARAKDRLDAQTDAAARGETMPRPMPGQPARPMPTGRRQHDIALLQLDGCMLHERPDWTETKISVISDLAAHVVKPPSAGEIARAQLEGREPRGRGMLTRKEYVGSSRTFEEFKARLWEAGVRWGLPTAGEIAVTCDGAPWCCNAVRELFDVEGRDGHQPKLTLILDWKHAETHLQDAVAALPESSRTGFRRRWLRGLWERGNGRGLVRALRRAAARGLPPDSRDVLLEQAKYFNKRLSMLDYPAFRAAGLPVGSGAMEGACGHVVQDRCKRRSMTWSSAGLGHTLDLRLFRINDRWHDLYPHAA